MQENESNDTEERSEQPGLPSSADMLEAYQANLARNEAQHERDLRYKARQRAQRAEQRKARRAQGKTR
jgi:hypothetical protein